METPAKVTVLILHYSKPSSSEETTESICTKYSTSGATPSHVYGRQSCWLEDVIDYGGTSADEGDEVNAEPWRGGSWE